MKKTLLFSWLALSVSSAFAGYDSSWYLDEYWVGEYPNAISIVKKGVKVPGRPTMDKDRKPTMACELPYKAVFSPWNSRRNRLSAARYYTAAKIIVLTAEKDFDLAIDECATLAIRKGDRIEYMIYGAEGYFTVRIAGKLHSAGQDLFEDGKVSGFPEAGQDSDEWIQVKCMNGRTAWVSVDEATRIQGVASGPWGGMQEYGKVRDLTTAEAEAAARENGWLSK
jgi:hypothetical protein